MNTEMIWQKFLETIKNTLSDITYETWFKENKLIEFDENTIKILVPDIVHKKHLKENYNETVEAIFNEITGSNFKVEYYLEEELTSDIKINTDVIGVPTSAQNNNFNSNLIKEYTFNSFIVGKSNKFARATALAVAEQPGKMYNPLFIYASSGLGKTHLIHAIGNYIVENSNKKVLYVTCEQFVNDFIELYRKNKEDNNLINVDNFKNKYRSVDVLIIDDIQFLGGATQTQQEFFHTFNTLYSDSKQIIISSDRSPDDLKLLEDRLRTRFCWGLTVNIFPPDFNLRVEIIKRKIIAGNFEKEISEDVIEYIASNMGSDVRQLEGSITRLVAYSAIMGGSEINLELAIEALKDFISKGISEKNDVHRIQKVVAEYFQISVEDIRSKKRSSNIAFPRQIAMYLCRKLTSESFPKIGTEFGGKDHSTVMHSVEKIENEIKVNPDLANIIEKIKEDIQ